MAEHIPFQLNCLTNQDGVPIKESSCKLSDKLLKCKVA